MKNQLGVDVPMTEEIFIDADEFLWCPFCRSANLHQERVVAAFRDFEDGPGLCTFTKTSHVETVHLAADEIEGRRDVLDINFSCEGCGKKPTLQIMQHKGSTVITWK